MVTFCVFCISAMLSIYAMSSYGIEIFTEPKDNYYETEMYQNALHVELQTILSSIEELGAEEAPNGTLSILDMSDNTIHYYDEKAMNGAMYSGIYCENMSGLKDYELEEPLKIGDEDLSDFNELKSYLESDENVPDYIYFNQAAFKKLFEKEGLLNTDYRFSDLFSEDAYFVFENYKVIQKASEESVSEEPQTTEDTESTTEETKKIAVETEEITIEEESKELQTEEKEPKEIVITPYNLTSYAVYDPKEEIFYSRNDDYFDEMDSYVYSIDEVLQQLQKTAKEGCYYNSIVIPLLRSYNNSVYEISSTNLDLYSGVLSAEEELDDCSTRGIYYYMKIDDDTCYRNAEKEEDIIAMERFYRFEKQEDGEIKQTHSTNVPDIDNLDSMKDSFSDYPESTVLCIGFKEEDVTWLSAPPFLMNADMYKWLAKNSYQYVILTAVSFLLLIAQAVWLLYTTGRQYKGDKDIKLCHFDRWYTEIWVAVTILLLVFSVMAGLFVLDEIRYRQSIGVRSFYTAIGVLPFGFMFMILTLSLARRLKAHNIGNRLLIVRFGTHIMNRLQGKKDITWEDEEKKPSAIAKICYKFWNHCKQAFYEIKGTRKLLVIFVFYMIAGIILLVAFVGTSDGLLPVLFMLLQGVALIVVLVVVRDLDKLTEGVKEIIMGNLDSKVEINEKVSVFGDLANGINHIGDGLKSAVETSLKDERMKTALITNVSHDLKTPLTSIINYVDLLKKQEMPNEEAKHYVDVLDGKAQRLKQLTEDLVEAAKATSGNIELEMMPITFDELMKQALGEFEDKFEKKKLTIVATYPEQPAVVRADGKRLFRIIENVLQNIYKYALEGTRVYADLSKTDGVVTFTLKNVSSAPLNISADELMERFTRGDSSRTTEGSGLGLSIAKDLTRLQNGEFEIQLDGDLFKVIIRFSEYF